MTNYINKNFWISLGIGAVALGYLTSVSVLSFFHIFTLIPFFIIFWNALVEQKMIPFSAKCIIAFILWSLISNFYNFHVLTEPLESFGKIKYWFFTLMGVFGVHYWLKLVSVQTKRKLINIFFFTIILSTVYGYIKHFHNYDLIKFQKIIPDDGARIGGFTGVMRYGYGMSLVLTLLVGVFLHFEKFQNYINKKTLIVMILITFAGVYFSYTRGALLGFLCSIPFILYFYKKTLAIYATIGVGLILTTLLVISLNGGSQKSRFLISSQAGTNTKRLSQYQAALYAIKEAPLFGFGLKQFSYEVPRLKEKYQLKHPEYASHSHNILLETAASGGILALVFFILWIAFWARELLISNGLAKVLVIPFIVNFFISGQFEYTLDANNSLFNFLIYCLSLYEYQEQNDELITI